MAWRWIALRSAGFAADEVLRFAAPATTAAIDRLCALEDAARAERARAIEVLERSRDDGGRDRAMRKVLAKLRGGGVPETAPDGIDLAPLRAAVAAVASARRAVDADLASDGARIDAATRALARDPRFREAIAWQNRALLATLLAPLLAAPAGTADAAARRRQVIVAGYAQRYATKNDTIGFFGPVGWARLTDAERVVEIRPAADLLDVRDVHYEYWGIDALATRLAEDPELRPVLAPRRMPAVRLEGDTVHYPIGRSQVVPHAIAAVLAACDGATPASAIVETLARDPELGLEPSDVLDVLEELAGQRLVRWTLEVPTAGQHPERHLQAALAGLPACAARERAVERFAEIEAARAAVTSAAGDADALDRALGALEERFAVAAGVAATRRAGQTYAARTLIYEDTRRAVDVELGGGFGAAIAEPLALVMHAARWYTHEIAARYRPILEAAYRELRERRGEARVDYMEFLDRVLPELATQHEVAPPVRAVVDELQRRWAAILGLVDHDERRVIAHASSDLRAAALRAFPAPCPGWPQARYQSPDVMVAAAGPAAFARGDFTAVLGEIHAGTQTFTSVFVNLHPDPAEIARARRADLGPLIATVEPRAGALRTDHVNFADDDLDIEVGDAKSWRARAHVLEAGQLVVESIDGRLHACTRDGRERFDLVAVLEGHFVLAATTHFQLLPAATHQPRITIDRLVLGRETWTFEPAELAFLELSGADRLIGARKWARRHALPRFVFLRVPQEPKPCFVDLHSPVYIEALVRFARKATRLTVSEMLPSLDQTWLVDAEGRTYCAELRMTLVDPEPWRPT